MDVSIELDRPEASYTNGEALKGHVIFYCKRTVVLSKVTVTLSGKSISIVSGSSSLMLNRRNRVSHRIVHETEVITPRLDTTTHGEHNPNRLNFGYHSFPFQLKIPRLSKCSTCPASSSGDLPPSMQDVVQNAEIMYKLETSVIFRCGLFKDTVTKIIGINVWPLDTRPIFMARTVPDSFPCTSGVLASVPSFIDHSNRHRDSEDPANLPYITDPAQILVEARFPEQYGLTCGNDVAMSLNIRKTAIFSGSLYLQSFQMLLIGYTDVGAQTDTHVEVESWMIQSLSNLNIHVSDADRTEGSETAIDSGLWRGKPLPLSVIPSFKTCNVGRRYQLEISMGLQCMVPKGRIKIIQLRLPVQVYSGIFPGQHVTTGENDGPQTSIIDVSIQRNDSATRDYRRQHESHKTQSVSRVSRENSPALQPPDYGSPPPTYAYAILTSINDGQDEKSQPLMGGSEASD